MQRIGLEGYSRSPVSRGALLKRDVKTNARFMPPLGREVLRVAEITATH